VAVIFPPLCCAGGAFSATGSDELIGKRFRIFWLVSQSGGVEQRGDERCARYLYRLRRKVTPELPCRAESEPLAVKV